MEGFFHNLGRRVGRSAVPALRKSKWIWDGLTGSEEDALRAEIAFGRALAVELRNETRPIDDPKITQLTNEICRRLSKCVRDEQRIFAVEVFQDEAPNAMALPGGFIFISDALLDLCRHNPDELAFILGHEMGHIIREHVWNRMLNQTATRAAAIVMARAGPLGMWLRHKGMTLLQSAHSQDMETEADEFGVRLANAARYKANAAFNLLRRLEQLHAAGNDLGQYFSSHPSPAKRIAHLSSFCR